MADTVGHILVNNLSKCRCCRQCIDKIKHAVNLFGDKSLKEGIKEGLELYGGSRVKEDVNTVLMCYHTSANNAIFSFIPLWNELKNCVVFVLNRQFQENVQFANEALHN
jgi:hypothetical protein